MSVVEKIKEIENEMARTQKNKATAHHLGLLKAKLAKLRRELLTPKGGSSSTGEGFDVAKTGIARIGFVGFPSVGKSTIMTKLTGTYSAVAEYEFTTLTTVPGVLHYTGAKIQILDLPGILEGAKDGRGRGKQVIAVARTCTLVYIVLDITKPIAQKQKIEQELEGFGIRLNKTPPDITFAKKDRGGINIRSTCKLTHLDDEGIKIILKEYRILNVDIMFRCDATPDELIDALEGNRVYIPALYILNKIDSISYEELCLVSRIKDSVPVSAEKGWNLDGTLEASWDKLRLIRVFAKPRGQLPDYSTPVVLREGRSSIKDFCNSIHRGILSEFKNAVVWGKSVKHTPQRVGKEHVLMDEDVVQIIKKR
jgi:small GTP-binding protein